VAEAGETRLDRLWQAVQATGADDDWLRFYEGFAAQRLIVPLEGQASADGVRLMTLKVESGEVALAFDGEARFAAFIREPTDYVTLTGAELAKALAPKGAALALNPGAEPGETVLDAEALGWVARHAGAEVEVEESATGTEVRPPIDPEEPLLEGLGLRVAELGAAVAEAWLIATVSPKGKDAYLCVIRPAEETKALASAIATELTRVGQIRASRPFGVAVVKEGAKLLAAARRFGIGLGVPGGSSPA